MNAAVGGIGVPKEGDDLGEVQRGEVANGGDVSDAGEDEGEEFGTPEAAELAVPEGEEELNAEGDEGVLGLDGGGETGGEAQSDAL